MQNVLITIPASIFKEIIKEGSGEFIIRVRVQDAEIAEEPCPEKKVADANPVILIVTNLMQGMGFPAHIKGYYYLRQAICLAIEDPTILNSITRGLYPAIAEANNSNPKRVERAIRHAIYKVWTQGNPDGMQKVLGTRTTKDQPTNFELISGIVDYIKIRQPD